MVSGISGGAPLPNLGDSGWPNPDDLDTFEGALNGLNMAINNYFDNGGPDKFSEIVKQLNNFSTCALGPPPPSDPNYANDCASYENMNHIIFNATRAFNFVNNDPQLNITQNATVIPVTAIYLIRGILTSLTTQAKSFVTDPASLASVPFTDPSNVKSALSEKINSIVPSFTWADVTNTGSLSMNSAADSIFNFVETIGALLTTVVFDDQGANISLAYKDLVDSAQSQVGSKSENTLANMMEIAESFENCYSGNYNPSTPSSIVNDIVYDIEANLNQLPTYTYDAMNCTSTGDIEYYAGTLTYYYYQYISNLNTNN